MTFTKAENLRKIVLAIEVGTLGKLIETNRKIFEFSNGFINGRCNRELLIWLQTKFIRRITSVIL